MALSNMLREPRREITETVVGVTALGGVLTAIAVPAWYLGTWLYSLDHSPLAPFGFYLVMAVFLIAASFLMGCAFFAMAHALGDAVCTALQSRGIHLRPKQRY